ncbi:MAG: NAD-dependent epimerase/dehydratase family protein [Phycisphaerae bacterium]|nr:NAD-dependent epimerase/dehydratase family protein [Phycisphaerae bacterium]
MIGSHLVARLVDAGAAVTVADNLWRGTTENLTRDGRPVINLDNNLLKLDLTDYASCVRAVEGQEVVYHLADVVAGINYVFGNQLSLFHNNVLMNSNIVHAATGAKVGQFIYVGTVCSCRQDLQNKLGGRLLTEEDAYPADPESSYGWSKLMGEYECELAEKEGRLEIGTLRLHNVYGPNCDMSPERSQVIPSLIRKALNHPDEEYTVWGSGKQRRAFVYVDDVIESLLAVLEKGMGQGVIQIGPDYSTSVKEIAEKIVQISGKEIPIVFDTSKREGDLDRAADYTKAKRVLGWEPRTDMDRGLNLTYEWCRKEISANEPDRSRSTDTGLTGRSGASGGRA